MNFASRFLAKFDKRDLIFLIWIFILSRIIILVIGTAGYTIFPQEGSLLQPRPMHQLLDFKDHWHNFDSGWFETLARDGYPQKAFSADKTESWGFLPLYPLIVKAISLVAGPHYFWIGVIVSNIFAFLATLVTYRLMKERFKQGHKKIVTLLLLSAGSFYLSINYAEALFVLLTALVFYTAYKKPYGWSLVFAGLGAVTRIHGLLLFVIPLLELGRHYRKQLSQYLKYIPWLLAAVLPMSLLMFYLYQTSGEPLAFIKIQAAWGSPRTYPLQGLGVFITGLNQFKDYLHLFFILLYTVVYLSARKTMPLSYSLFALGFLLISTSNEALYGSTRYVLAALPVFMAASLSNTYVYRSFLYINVAFLGLSVASFVTALPIFI